MWSCTELFDEVKDYVRHKTYMWRHEEFFQKINTLCEVSERVVSEDVEASFTN